MVNYKKSSRFILKSIRNTSGKILKHSPIPLIRILIYSLLVILIFNSCSTKKNTFTRRVYHNLTAHYNTYWNGNESFKEGLRTLDENVKDNYAMVLPVYKYGNAQDAQSVTPNMDRAIEKSSKVIQRHSMYFSRKEWVKKIDDSYLLIGKSYLYKREFSSARRTFEFVINRFKDEDSQYEAELWLARTYNQNKEFEKAESVLDNFNSSLKKGEAPSKLEKDFAMIYADFYLQQSRYGEAIRYLQRAIEINNKKKIKNRMRFILAQVYQELGEMDNAAALYQQVIRKNPGFEMAFNAKINLAKTYDTKSSNRSRIVNQLNKMLKDGKNEDFRDQIYFALAEIYLKDGQKDQGTEYLRLSVATSVSNDYQKSISSLMLAEIHFEKPEYNLAQAYYDTAMQFLPREYAAYDELKVKTDILTDLITNLQAIQEQDSLQRMAQMPEAERNAILDELIKKIAEEEARQREEERERRQSLSMLEQTSRQENRNMQRAGGWYFSNPQAVSFGFSEFQKKWGRRKLEDLWRLSNKQLVDFGEEDELAEGQEGAPADSTLTPKETDPKKREFYLQDLPITEEQMQASNDIIEDALFHIGYIYKDGLKNNLKSIEAFEELISKFPEHEHRLQVYYQLYKNFEEVPDLTKAEYYKNLIVQEFPDSDYAKIIIDPNYNLVLEAQRNAAANLYYETYNAYMNDQFYLVINNYNVAAERYQESDLISKFEFLKSLSLGQIQNLDSLAVSLQKLIDNYPDSEIQPIASDILAKLRPGEDGQMVFDEDAEAVEISELTEEEKAEQEAISMYSYAPDAVHFFMALADASTTNINALKIRLSDFNTRFFPSAQLKINSIVFLDEIQLITVGNFENSEMAINYYESMLRNEYVTSQVRDVEKNTFVVSVDNYPVFYREKDVEAYLKFFNNEYLEK
jgi:tetratricopeptide (TPR) repeat protein